MMHEGTNGEAGFLRPLINAYSSLPLHGITAIPGKISGALMVAEAIVDAVPLIHGPIGCSFQRKINPFRPYLPFYETPCTDMHDLEVVYGGEDKLRMGIREVYERHHPNLIVVITTCASDLIGDDFKAVIEETKAKGDVGCEVVYTTGDFTEKSKPVGYQDALYAITDQMLCNGVEKEVTDKNDGSVNIVTFPIHGAGLKVAEMASVLIEEIGDVYPYHVLSIGARAYGLGVFSRYPLTQLDTSHLSDPNWRVQALRVEADDRHFILYNVHLQVSNVLGYLETGASAAKEVEASVRGRESQVRRLVADIGRRSEPVVVAGDFNSTDQSDGYRILSKCLTDAYRRVGWGFGHTFPAYGGSWHGLPILPREMRIDMIFCSDEFVPLRCEVGTAHGESDHLPVIARLDWRR